MSDGLMLKLTRTNGATVNINGGAISSCEDSFDEHLNQYVTTIVTSGEDGDVYQVRERRVDVERMMNHYLDKMIRERLRAMEADPSWARTFRDALNDLQVMIASYKLDEYEVREIVVKLYQRSASAYNMRELKRGAALRAKYKELYEAIKLKQDEEKLRMDKEAEEKAKEEKHKHAYGGYAGAKYEYIWVDENFQPIKPRKPDIQEKIAELAKKYAKREE